MWVKNGERFVNPLKYAGMVVWNPTEAQLVAAGYHFEIDPVPEPTPLTVCKKYQLVRCLETFHPAMLAEFRAAYVADADLNFYYNTVIELDRNDSKFKWAQEKLGVSDETVDEIFEGIRVHAEEWSM